MAQYSTTVQTLLDRIDDLQSQIEVLRPIKPDLVSRIFQKYRLDWNYNSNSIEGNSLNYGETVAFIMEGLTAKGKPLKDHLDIKGHNDAIDFLVDMQQKGSELTERDIRGLHQMILVEPYQSKAQTASGQATTKTIQLGVYKSSPNHVETRTGEIHYYATPEETPVLMHELIEWYRTNRESLHPLVLSTLFHHRFVAIHPFDDGNGRMSRLLSNLILMQAGLPPVVVRKDQKGEYYGVLSQADAGVTDPLIEYFASLLIHSLEIYLKGAQGGDISEASDLEKQLALFVAGFDEEVLSKKQLSTEVIEELYPIAVEPLFAQFSKHVMQIQKLFFETYVIVLLETIDNNLLQKKREVALIDSIGEVDKDLLQVFILNAIIDAHDSAKPTQYSQLVFKLRCVGFKAIENTEEVIELLLVVFFKEYYIVKTIGANSLTIKKSYVKPLSSDDIQSVMSSFFGELMNDIKSASNKALDNKR